MPRAASAIAAPIARPRTCKRRRPGVKRNLDNFRHKCFVRGRPMQSPQAASATAAPSACLLQLKGSGSSFPTWASLENLKSRLVLGAWTSHVGHASSKRHSSGHSTFTAATHRAVLLRLYALEACSNSPSDTSTRMLSNRRSESVLTRGLLAGEGFSMSPCTSPPAMPLPSMFSARWLALHRHD